MDQRNVDEKRLMRVAQGVEDAGGIFEQVRGAKERMLEAKKMSRKHPSSEAGC